MEPQHEPKKQSLKERLKALWNYFSTYEKIWFFSILILASVFAVLFPEEDVNGVNGGLIMALYLADTFLNILCELLISKQSKWNFIVSVFVEITEILICVVLAYRFATMATTLFFWLPIDIISFINWHKHPDHQETSLTRVRKLSGWAEVAVLAGVVLWTVGVGYFLTTLDFGTDLFHGNETLEVIVCYLDACASAVGVCNGIFILLRIREQWIAWYISALLEAASGAEGRVSDEHDLRVHQMERVHPQAQGRIRARHEAVLNFLFFLERKESKRKSIAGKLSLAAFAAFANALHKTDGSHTNRLLFFLKEKKQKKIIYGTVVSLRSCGFRQRASQNGRFTYEPSVFTFQAGRAGKHLFSERHPPPQCLLFLFFKKRNRSPLEEKKSYPL